MKTVLIIMTISLSTQALGEELATCEHWRDFSGSIMGVRQAGVSKIKALSVTDNPDVTQLAVIDAAYRVPLGSTEPEKRRKIEEFQDTMYAGCVLEEQSRQ